MERCNGVIEVCKVTLHTWRKSKKGCRHVSTAELCIDKTIVKNTVIHNTNNMRYIILHQQNTFQQNTTMSNIQCIDSPIPVSHQRLVVAEGGEGRVNSGTRACGCDS